jgi:hypothetical protein
MRRLNRSLFFIFPVLSSTNIFKNSWFSGQAAQSKNAQRHRQLSVNGRRSP